MKEMVLSNQNVIQNLIRYLDMSCNPNVGVCLKMVTSFDMGGITKLRIFDVVDKLTLIPNVVPGLYEDVRSYCFNELHLDIGDVMSHRIVLQAIGTNEYVDILYVSMTVSLPKEQFDEFIEEGCSLIASSVSETFHLDEYYESLRGMFPEQEFQLGTPYDVNHYIDSKIEDKIRNEMNRRGLLNRSSNRNYIKPSIECVTDEYDGLLQTYFSSCVFGLNPCFCIAVGSNKIQTQLIPFDLSDGKYHSNVDIDKLLNTLLSSVVLSEDKVYIAAIFVYIYVESHDEYITPILYYVEFCGKVVKEVIVNELIGSMNKLMSVGSYISDVNSLDLTPTGISEDDVFNLIQNSKFDNLNLIFECDKFDDVEHYLVPMITMDPNDGIKEANNRLREWSNKITLIESFYESDYYIIRIYLKGLNYRQILLHEFTIGNIQVAMMFKKSVLSKELLYSLKTFVQKSSRLPKFGG